MSDTPPTPQEFERLVEAIFGPLMKENGFRGPDVARHPPETSVAYERDDLRVIIFYEYADCPWVTVDRRGKSGKWTTQSLDKLIKGLKLGGSFQRPKAGEVTGANMQSALTFYAAALRKMLDEA